MFSFLFLLSLGVGGFAIFADYMDRKHPFDARIGYAFGHIEISVERPLEIEFERPSPTIFGPDFV